MATSDGYEDRSMSFKRDEADLSLAGARKLSVVADMVNKFKDISDFEMGIRLLMP
jgi:hypothetical protein